MWMLKGLQTKLVLILVLLTVSVMLVVGTVLINSVSSFYRNNFMSQMNEALGEALVSLEDKAAGEDAVAQMQQVLESYRGMMGVNSYRNYYILDEHGGYLEGSNPSLGKTLEKTRNLLTAMAGEVGQAVSPASDSMDYALPVGEYIVYVRDSMDEVRALTWEILSIIIQTMFVGLLIAILLSYFLAKTITNPIENLTQGARRIAGGDFSYKLRVQSDDEIGTLTTTFNDMAKVLKGTLEEIDKERNKLRTLFLYLTDGVAAFDQNGLLLHINRAAQELLGARCEEGCSSFDDMFGFARLPVPFGELLRLPSHQNLVQDAVVGERILKMHFAAFHMDASEDNFSAGVIAVIHDVTEQQRLENSRREFIADVSHELRTPLTNVKSYTETVLENEDLPRASVRRFLGVVLSETDRMIRIVKDLLVLSRLENRKMEWKRAPFSVPELLERVYEAMRIEAQRSGHHMTLDADGPEGEVIGDRERIEQVMVNVVSNAVKYTRENGEIRIRAFQEGSWVRITVSDNGVGIPKEDLPRIFERFYRVDKARSREMGGTGLGLAIAKEIVEAHGGRIEIQSELEKGTTVTVLLPVDGGGPESGQVEP